MHLIKFVFCKWYLFFLTLNLFSCETKENESITPDHIVLIIDHCPNYSVYKHESVTTSSEDDIEISYIDDDLILHSYCTAKEPTRDTLIFPARSNLIEIEHEYKNFEHISFLFQRGDTVLFTYDNDFPKAEVLNRPKDSLSANYVKLRREKLMNDQDVFEGLALFNFQKSRLFFSQVKKRLWGDAGKRYNAEQTIGLLNVLEEHNRKELALLDSLLTHGVISTEIYTFYRQKMEVQYAFAKNEYLNSLPKPIGSEPGPPTIHEWQLLDSIRKDLIRFNYYNWMLSRLEFKKYHTIVPKLPFTARKIPDYRYVYDSIVQTSSFTNQEKKILLTNCIKKLIEHFPEDDIAKYFHAYMEDVQSEALITHVANEYQDMIPQNLLNEIDGISNTVLQDSTYNLSLLTVQGKQVEFDGILEKYKGKMVYVDVWSSTCLPCLIAMPYSIQLEREFENKDVQFIYISMDKDQEKWKKSMDKIVLNSEEASFMVDPDGNNKMLEELNIQYIPRYLLFDKTGKLVQYRAFSPKSENIRSTFTKYLSAEL